MPDRSASASTREVTPRRWTRFSLWVGGANLMLAGDRLGWFDSWYDDAPTWWLWVGAVLGVAVLLDALVRREAM